MGWWEREREGGGAPGLTHAPHRSPFVNPLLPLRHLRRCRPRMLRILLPRAGIFFPSVLCRSSSSFLVFTSFLFREFRRSVAAEFFDTHVCTFFSLKLRKYFLFATYDHLIFEWNFCRNDFRLVRFVLAISKTFEFSINRAMGCISLHLLESTLYIDKAAFSLFELWSAL